MSKGPALTFQKVGSALPTWEASSDDRTYLVWRTVSRTYQPEWSEGDYRHIPLVQCRTPQQAMAVCRRHNGSRHG